MTWTCDINFLDDPNACNFAIIKPHKYITLRRGWQCEEDRSFMAMRRKRASSFPLFRPLFHRVSDCCGTSECGLSLPDTRCLMVTVIYYQKRRFPGDRYRHKGIDRQILVDILTISAVKHNLWQLVWEKKHILLLCSMLHEPGYP